MAKRVTTKAAKKGNGAAAPLGTKQRIVLHSISLFNRSGIQGVPIERICSDLKISPGNLTYYFPRKDDLIREAVEVLKEHMREALERPVQVNSPKDGAEYLIRLFRTFWDFRFYFNSIAFLLTEDSELRAEYNGFRDWLLGIMETDIEYLAKRGYFNPLVAPNNFRLLSDNIYGLMLTWLRTEQIENPDARTPSKAALRDVALHLWSLCQLWMVPAFAQSLLRVFDELLADAPSANRGTASGTRRTSSRTTSGRAPGAPPRA
jgi:AcrR family transcriptional regulator